MPFKSLSFCVYFTSCLDDVKMGKFAEQTKALIFKIIATTQ